MQYRVLYGIQYNIHQAERLVLRQPIPQATWMSVYGTLYKTVGITVYITRNWYQQQIYIGDTDKKNHHVSTKTFQTI